MNNDRDFRICIRLLALAKDRTANEHVRKEARRLAARILRRHKWKASDFSDCDPDHPGLTCCETKIEGPLSAFQKFSGAFLVQMVPGLRHEIFEHRSCSILRFRIPMPKIAKEVMVTWEQLSGFMAGEFDLFIRHEVELDQESFCRGFCQGLGETVEGLRRMAAKVALKAKVKEMRERRMRPPEPPNPLALICLPRPASPIEPGVVGPPPVVEVGPEQAPQHETAGSDTPDQSTAGADIKVDTRSYSSGFHAAKRFNVDAVLKLI